MLWLSTFAIPSHNTDGQAASPAHKKRSRSGAMASECSGVLEGPPAIADAPLNTTNAPKHADHRSNCVRVASNGSSATGYSANAASDARLEMANNRYGDVPPGHIDHHACTMGPVEDIRRYGSLSVTASIARMDSAGSAPEAGFQPGSRRRGIVRQLAARSTRWTAVRTRGRSC